MQNLKCDKRALGHIRTHQSATKIGIDFNRKGKFQSNSMVLCVNANIFQMQHKYDFRVYVWQLEVRAHLWTQATSSSSAAASRANMMALAPLLCARYSIKMIKIWKNSRAHKMCHKFQLKVQTQPQHSDNSFVVVFIQKFRNKCAHLNTRYTQNRYTSMHAAYIVTAFKFDYIFDSLSHKYCDHIDLPFYFELQIFALFIYIIIIYRYVCTACTRF